jgi:hypothetical protein
MLTQREGVVKAVATAATPEIEVHDHQQAQ